MLELTSEPLVAPIEIMHLPLRSLVHDLEVLASQTLKVKAVLCVV